MTDSHNTASESRSQSEVFSPPRPTYVPAAAALGIMLLLWGFLTMWIMSVVGAGLLAWAVANWVHEIRYKWRVQ